MDYPFHGCIHVYLESSLDTHEMVLVRVSMTIRTWLKDFFYLQAAKKKNMSDPDPLSSPLRSRVHWVPRPTTAEKGKGLANSPGTAGSAEGDTGWNVHRGRVRWNLLGAGGGKPLGRWSGRGCLSKEKLHTVDRWFTDLDTSWQPSIGVSVA